MLRRETQKIRELLEEMRLAAAACGVARSALERWIERREFAPQARTLHGQATHGAQHFAPERVRRREAMFPTASRYERTAAQPHFRGKCAHERAGADASLSHNGHDAAFPAHHVIQVVRQLRERFSATHEAGEIERVRPRGKRARRRVTARGHSRLARRGQQGGK